MVESVNIHRPTGLLSATITGTSALGMIASLTTLVGGSGYNTPGTYTGVSLTGGAGSGAKATIVVAGGAVTSVTLTDGGSGYSASDSLSAADANIGGRTAGAAFTIVAATVAAKPFTLVAASPGNRCRVYRLQLVGATAASVTIKRGSVILAGATALTGAMAFAANSGLTLEPPGTWIPWFVTGVNEALAVTTDVATALAGEILYSLESA